MSEETSVLAQAGATIKNQEMLLWKTAAQLRTTQEQLAAAESARAALEEQLGIQGGELAEAAAAHRRLEAENTLLRDGLYVSPPKHADTTTEPVKMCRGCLYPKGGWPNPQQWEGEHGRDCWVDALLASPASSSSAGEGEGMPKCCRNWAYDPSTHGEWGGSERHHPACAERASAEQAAGGEAN